MIKQTASTDALALANLLSTLLSKSILFKIS